MDYHDIHQKIQTKFTWKSIDEIIEIHFLSLLLIKSKDNYQIYCLNFNNKE